MVTGRGGRQGDWEERHHSPGGEEEMGSDGGDGKDGQSSGRTRVCRCGEGDPATERGRPEAQREALFVQRVQGVLARKTYRLCRRDPPNTHPIAEAKGPLSRAPSSGVKEVSNRVP